MSTDAQHTTTAADRVPWNQLIAFGMGGLIPIALFNIAGQLMGLLGNISLGLSAFWLGTIMIIPRLWEAFSDPIIGHLSDNTRSRWGRRRPYILIGGLAVAISFVAMWWVPRGDWIRDIFPGEVAYNRFQLAYIFGGLLIFFTASAVFEIPHGALGLEMSLDPHERTRLFSAKSFLGNLFALGTPWLILLANLEFFRGSGGDLVDGMRYVTIFIAAVLVPMTFWWFLSLREPGFRLAKEQKKSQLWHDLRATTSNKTFLLLTAAIFTLAMGFNFVTNFANYITIFYLYGGDITPASLLLGINGMVWAFTALVAVFPLNWISRRVGKRNALIISILLMCAAQISKIFCYRTGVLAQFDLPTWLFNVLQWFYNALEWLLPDRIVPDWLQPATTVTIQAPYLILIPTMLLSAGMLMFFTLGASMVGDVCDEDELKTGTRSEGIYYSVNWWFIKMGTAFASLVTGVLLVFTAFDERQNVSVEALRGEIAVIKEQAEKWQKEDTKTEDRLGTLRNQLSQAIDQSNKLQQHFAKRARDYPDQSEHFQQLIQSTAYLRSQIRNELRASSDNLAADPDQVIRLANNFLQQTTYLKQQAPKTLFRLRLVEIGVPLALSIVSILLTLRYPLTEARSYEIKAALQQRHAETAADKS